MRLLLAFFMIGLLQSGCSRSDDETSGGASVGAAAGAALYQEWSCWTCHGPQGEGSHLGPELIGLSQWWESEQQLAAYLAAPDSARQHNTRLQALGDPYRPVSMPGFADLSVEQRRALAAYVLTFR